MKGIIELENKKKLLITAIVSVCLLLGAGVLYTALTADRDTTASAQGEIETYDFTVYDKDGNKVDLSDHKGKPVVVNFWASWCGFCKQEMPDFQSAYEKYGDSVQFMMIDLTGGGNESAESGDQLISDGGYTFPVFYDNDSSAANAYGTRSIPVTIFVGADGKVKYRNNGVTDSSTLESYIDDLLKQ